MTEPNDQTDEQTPDQSSGEGAGEQQSPEAESKPRVGPETAEPVDDADEAFEAAQEAIDDLDAAASGQADSAEDGDSGDASETPSFRLPHLDGDEERGGGAATSNGGGAGIDLLSDVNLHVKIELGRTRMYVEDVLKLAEGAVVELDKLAGDPVDVYVNDRLVVRGEVLIVNDNFCVRINEILGKVAAKEAS